MFFFEKRNKRDHITFDDIYRKYLICTFKENLALVFFESIVLVLNKI